MKHTNNIKILCTRPLTPRLISKGEKKGFRIDVVPFIRTEPLHSDELKTAIQDFSARRGTAIFTSMNAAEIIIKELNGAKPEWTIFCVGNTTHDTLTKYFGKDAIAGVATNAYNLAHAIIKAGNVQQAIFFCGDQRRDELPVILAGHQIKVEEVIVYKTTAVLNNITENYEGILFFSPSAVGSFFSNNTIDQHTVLFAIGDTTAAAIKKHSANTVVISEGPSKENLVMTMIAFYEERRLEKVFNLTEE